MRKHIVISLFALFVLSALILSACGGSGNADLSDSKYVGTWKAEGMSLGDASEAIEDDYIMTLNGDGTGTIVDPEETSEFKWEPVKDGFKTSGDMNVTFKDDGDKITTNILGVDLTFVRQ